MAIQNLAAMLTGETLGIPRDHLDTYGWVTAHRVYENATYQEQLVMEKGLALALFVSNNWDFIADAIYLARALRMGTTDMRDAVVYSSRFVPPEHRAVVTVEARRYQRDVPAPQPQSPPSWNSSSIQIQDTTGGTAYPRPLLATA